MTDPTTDPTQALEGGDSGASDASDDNANEAQPGTFYLPKDFLGGKTFKAGDKITLSVVGEDEDGDVEVSLGDSGSAAGSWKDDLKQSLSQQGGDQGGT
jgi:hypothetical protein